MANLVSQIVTSAKSIIQAELGTDWAPLRFVFDLAKNDYRTASKAFGFIPQSASFAETVIKTYTLDHDFDVILVESIARTHDDSDKETALGVLYDKSDEIFRQLVNTKIALPAIVLNIDQPNIAAPEFLDGNKVVILRMTVTVKYRSAL